MIFSKNYLASHLAGELCCAANLQVDSGLTHLEHQTFLTSMVPRYQTSLKAPAVAVTIQIFWRQRSVFSIVRTS